MKLKSYSEFRLLPTFEERFDYLNLNGRVGLNTFGFDRWVNQRFYASREWHWVRNEVLIRDNGCDLGVPGYVIHVGVVVHHMNPLTPEDIRHGLEVALDPEYLITTSHRTHNAIHYGDASLIPRQPVERQSGDTKLW